MKDGLLGYKKLLQFFRANVQSWVWVGSVHTCLGVVLIVTTPITATSSNSIMWKLHLFLLLIYSSIYSVWMTKNNDKHVSIKCNKCLVLCHSPCFKQLTHVMWADRFMYYLLQTQVVVHDQQLLIFSTLDGMLVGVDKSTGETLWSLKDSKLILFSLKAVYWNWRQIVSYSSVWGSRNVLK